MTASYAGLRRPASPPVTASKGCCAGEPYVCFPPKADIRRTIINADFAVLQPPDCGTHSQHDSVAKSSFSNSGNHLKLNLRHREHSEHSRPRLTFQVISPCSWNSRISSLRPKLRLGLPPQPLDGQRADLVRRRLALNAHALRRPTTDTAASMAAPAIASGTTPNGIFCSASATLVRRTTDFCEPLVSPSSRGS